MPIPTLDITVGGAAANSYVDLPTADAYHDARLNTSPWSTATSDDKTRALLMAAGRLQVENWFGSRVTVTQRLAWPRIYVVKVDSISPGFGGYGGGYGWLFGDVYLQTEIPQQIKDAQCELALNYLAGFDDGGEDAIDSFTADGVSIKFRSSSTGDELPSTVGQLLCGLISGNQLMRG